MPPITALCMDLAMARLAQCNEVVPCMGAALSQRRAVVDFFCLHKLTFFEAHLTQRMLTHIAVTDALPCTAIASPGVRVAVILLIAFGFLLLVFLAEPPFRQLGTAGMRAWSLGFPGHTLTSV